MKKIATYFGIFSVLFVLFFGQAVLAQTKTVTGLVGNVGIVSSGEDRNLDIAITQAGINAGGILSIDLKLTGFKEQGEASMLQYQIFTKKEFANRIPTPTFITDIDLIKGKEQVKSFTYTLVPGDYYLEFYDTRSNVIYSPKEFSVVVEKPAEQPKNQNGSGELNLEKPESGSSQEVSIDSNTGNSEELLSQDEKFGNPFKNLGSFEKITSAVLTGIVIPVGMPVLAIFIMYTGFLFVKARGNPAELVNAKKAAKWTAIGGFIMIGALTIVQFIQATFNNITGM